MNKAGFEILAAGDLTTVYIYGGIRHPDNDGVMVDPEEFMAAVRDIDASQIDVRIASVGGDPVAAAQMYQTLVDHPAKVRTIVDSKAYSAGSMLLQAGDVRVARPMSIVMVHGPASLFVPGRGSAKDHREMAAAIEAHAEAMVPAYTRHGIPEETVRGWFASDEDTYFSAKAALEAGLIDDIVDSMPLAASAPQDYRIAAMGGLDEIAARRRPTQENAEMAEDKDLGTPGGAPDADKIVAQHSRTVKAATQQGIRAEAKRRGDITAVFADFYDADPMNPVTALHDQCMDDVNCGEIDARRKLMAYLASRSEDPIVARESYVMEAPQRPTPNASPREARFVVSRDQQDKRAEALSAALQIKAGLVTDRKRIDDERKGEYLALSLSDIMASELRASGYAVTGSREDIARRYINAMPILAAGPSHGTDHLPSVLGNIANLSAMQGWDGSEETWSQWTVPGTLNNYQTHTRANIALLDKLSQMLENQEWNYGNMADVKQRITGYFYGLKYSLSIQAIVNDDLGELSRTMMGWGEAASATVGDAVYALLTTAGSGGLGQVMDEDSKVLFHADHSNYVASGSGAAPSETTLNTARAAMVAQNDPNGRKVAVRPRHILHGPSLYSTVYKLLNSTDVMIAGSTDASSPTANSARSMGLNPIEEYRLTGSQWLLAAARRTVEVAGVGGPVSPRAEQSMVSNTPGITYELSMPFGVAVLDYRSMYYNHGA